MVRDLIWKSDIAMMIDHLSSMLEIFSSQMADISLTEISMMEDRLPSRREKLRFLMESRDIAKSRMHACKNLTPQMLYLLPSPSRSKVSWRAEEPTDGSLGRHASTICRSETTNEKCWRTTRKTRHCTERKELQVYPKDNRKGCIARKRKLCVLVEVI